MADLAPRKYGAGAYGRAPYENYSYSTVTRLSGQSATAGTVPLFYVFVWDDREMRGASLVQEGAARPTTVRQFAEAGASVTGAGWLSAYVDRFWAARAASVSTGIAGSEVLLGLSLEGRSTSTGVVSANALKSSLLAAMSASTAQTSLAVERLWASRGEATSTSAAVLSPLWQCEEIEAAEWMPGDSPGQVSWEEATIAQSSWLPRR